MGEFQCSSSWGYPLVLRLKYQAYRNYSRLSFSFDREERKIWVESTRIRDPRIRCFSWEFETDDAVNEEIDKLVAVGRLVELSCKRLACAVPAFWSADVEFDGKVNSCSSSSEYPFSVLAFEEGLMGLADRLACSIRADISDASLISAEYASGGEHLEFRISGWKEISISGRCQNGGVWSTVELSDADARELIDIMKDYPIDHPENYVERKGLDSGSIFFGYPNGKYRIDVEGKGPDWWDEFFEKVSTFIDKTENVQ